MIDENRRWSAIWGGALIDVEDERPFENGGAERSAVGVRRTMGEPGVAPVAGMLKIILEHKHNVTMSAMLVRSCTTLRFMRYIELVT